jgi:enoyl-CoA hydratase
VLGSSRDERSAAERTAAFNRICDRLESLEIPTVCGVDRNTYGCATDFASCDTRIGIHGSRMLMPAARLGVEYYYGGLRRYIERIGPPVAVEDTFLMGAPMDAESMLPIGFLSELTTPMRTPHASAFE